VLLITANRYKIAPIIMNLRKFKVYNGVNNLWTLCIIGYLLTFDTRSVFSSFSPPDFYAATHIQILYTGSHQYNTITIINTVFHPI
jgi:hypothetical protein